MRKLDLEKVSKELLDDLNHNAQELVNPAMLNSPRTIGYSVQQYLASVGLPKALKQSNISVDNNFSRRSMEDMAFSDGQENYYAIDVKTHNLDTLFNMPNLISVKRLAQFYRNDDKNHFCIIIASYRVEKDKLLYEDCKFKPIEAFSWKCLTLGALGWGQIQIANANKLIFEKKVNRCKWMLDLCDKVSLFYDEEISKIGERKTWSSENRQYWANKIQNNK